jgi:hypothetical protein
MKKINKNKLSKKNIPKPPSLIGRAEAYDIPIGIACEDIKTGEVLTKKNEKIKIERKKIEVTLRTPFSNKEIATLVVIPDGVAIAPVLVEKILEEQIRKILETVVMNGLYNLK